MKYPADRIADVTQILTSILNSVPIIYDRKTVYHDTIRVGRNGAADIRFYVIWDNQISDITGPIAVLTGHKRRDGGAIRMPYINMSQSFELFYSAMRSLGIANFQDTYRLSSL